MTKSLSWQQILHECGTAAKEILKLKSTSQGTRARRDLACQIYGVCTGADNYTVLVLVHNIPSELIMMSKPAPHNPSCFHYAAFISICKISTRSFDDAVESIISRV